MELLQPKEITIQDAEGIDRTFILSKFPAVAGREIMAKYPISNMPKLGEYQTSEETMLKLMSYVAVDVNGQKIRFTTRDFINQHVNSWETLAKLEWAMMEYNCSFLRDGTLSNSLQGVVQNVLARISAILTSSSAPLSQTDAQASTS